MSKDNIAVVAQLQCEYPDCKNCFRAHKMHHCHIEQWPVTLIEWEDTMGKLLVSIMCKN